MDELEKLQNLLEFEKNKYNNIIKNLKNDINNNIYKSIKNELDGLKDIATLCDNAISQKINRRIDNINKILNKF